MTSTWLVAMMDLGVEAQPRETYNDLLWEWSRRCSTELKMEK